MELRFFSSANYLVILYMCIKFHENILDGIEVIQWTRFSFEQFQRDIFTSKESVELWVLFSAHRLIMLYTCIKMQDISDDIKVIQGT